MPLPRPTTLTLAETPQYVATRAEVSVDEAIKAILKAVEDYDIIPHPAEGKIDLNWKAEKDAITIDWEKNSIRHKSPYAPSTWEGVFFYRSQIDRWLRVPQIVKRPSAPQASKPARTGRSPTKGRPIGSGGLDDSIPLARMKSLKCSDERLGVKTAAEIVAAEMKMPEHLRIAAVARWRRKYRLNENSL